MPAPKTCDKCNHYSAPKRWDSEYEGSCDMMGDSNSAPPMEDRANGWDYESYRAGVYVGPKFGCIHWEKIAKVTP